LKASELIAKRQPSWRELERLCDDIGSRKSKADPKMVSRFASLYRAACADLALAEAWQLPPSTVEYLHRLVAKAHNQLYRTQKFQWRTWSKKIFEDTPKLIFQDPCVHLVTLLFWGLFLISAYLANNTSVWPGFAESVVGQEQLDDVREMYTSFGERDAGTNSFMMGFYVLNNASIGLNCFVTMLFVLPGLVTLTYNAVYLGAIFGFMFRPEAGEAGIHFKNFVTAHGPFELTAIVLSGGAGLKIGLSWLKTDGLGRLESLTKTARESLPIAMCAVALFCCAAVIEGFISPTPETILPWWVKGMVAVVSSGMLMFYFVVLGYPRNET